MLGRDSLRTIFGCLPIGKRHEEDSITIILEAAVDALLSRGRDVAVDATHLKPDSLDPWNAIASQRNATLRILDFSLVPLELCIERDRIRGETGGRRVGEEVIRRMAKGLIRD
jgi:predicted kinase